MVPLRRPIAHEEADTATPRTHPEQDVEESIREAAERSLRRNGYRTVSAHNGVEALAIHSRRQHELQAVLTDMAMPVMDVPALIRTIRAQTPALRLIAMSGLPAGDHDATATPGSVDGFLQKPFSPEQMLVTLHTVLEQSSASY